MTEGWRGDGRVKRWRCGEDGRRGRMAKAARYSDQAPWRCAEQDSKRGVVGGGRWRDVQVQPTVCTKTPSCPSLFVRWVRMPLQAGPRRRRQSKACLQLCATSSLTHKQRRPSSSGQPAYFTQDRWSEGCPKTAYRKMSHIGFSVPLGHPLRLDMTPARRLCPLMRPGAGGYAHLAFSINNGYNGFGDVSTEDDLRSEIPRRNNHRGLNARSQAQSVSRRTDANGQVEHSFQGNRDPKFLHSQPSLLTPFGLGGSPISRFLSRSFFWQHF